jgi:transcription initiation factor IIE alpha subunit
LELVLKKGIVETDELKVIYNLKEPELEKILYVLLESGLVRLVRRTYLAPTPNARIFLHSEDTQKDEIASDS